MSGIAHPGIFSVILNSASATCFAIAAPGLEPIVARELAALGVHTRIDDGGVTWEGDARSVMRANLWLRTASRVVVRVARFEATAFYELEQRAKKIPWDAFLAPGVAAEFRVTARKSKLYHSDAIAERLEKAVRSALYPVSNDRTERTAHSAQRGTQSTQLFIVRMYRDLCEISADTSGELLHARGYRQAVGKAPLRETLAAALLLASDWSGNSPLLDPLCGSGTIPIEGALLSRRIPPGQGRRFAFMNWASYDASQWKALIDDARAGMLASSPVPILASDRDAGAIDSARANAERAGVTTDVDFSVRTISAVEPPLVPGHVVTNPPYGVRVSKNANVRNLYAQLGHVLRRRCPGWRVALYAADKRLVEQTGLPFEEAFRTTNGGIKVAAMIAHVLPRSTAESG